MSIASTIERHSKIDEQSKILIIQTASLGDVILSTALMEKLHKQYPLAQIDLLVQKGAELLFSAHPYLSHLYVWNKKEKKYANLQKIIKAIRQKHYDLIVNVQRFASTGWVCFRSKAKQIVGFDKNPFSWCFSQKLPHEISAHKYCYEVDRNQRLIKNFTDEKSAPTRLYPSSADYDSVQIYKNNPYLTISPSSLWFTKQFPKEKWIDFLQILPSKYNIYLLGAKNDREYCDSILQNCEKKNIFNLSGKLSLLQSAALMQSAIMNYTNDSAPLHLAVSVQAQVTAIFCSTVKEFGFAPKLENVHIVETKEKLLCRPCGLHGHSQCPQKHFRCAYNIDVHELLKNIPL